MQSLISVHKLLLCLFFMSVQKLHQEMLSDRPRTEAYLQAVQMNEPFLRDKVSVLGVCLVHVHAF